MKSTVLVRLLSDGEYHSGESLATRLGVSRTAVWKQVHRAQEQGYPIETVRGKGYRLRGPLDLLDVDTIRAHLSPGLCKQIDLAVMDEVDSTNAEVLRRGFSGSDGRLAVCIADRQLQGRGRRGRIWHSPRGENLYMSMGLAFRGGFSVLDGLSLVFGVAVAEALENMGVPGVGLKWPNDLFLDGAKLGGILIELQGELEEGVIRVVAGVGMNVHMRDNPLVDQRWTSLARSAGDRDWQRNRIAAEVLGSVLDATSEFPEIGFAGYRKRWQQRDVFMACPVEAREGDLTGIGRGVDHVGNYLVETPDGVIPVRAGELSLRTQS